MNRYDFTQPGGFPFDQGVMEFIQDCINTAASTATLAGSLAILSGCTVAGGSVSNGVVVINGEILPFIGGVISAKVIIQETATALAYQDGTPRTVKYQRVAKFGDDGVSNNLWANFKRNTAEGILARLDRVEGLLSPLLVSGKLWWSGTKETIPAGFREVAAWRGKFPMHFNPDDPDFSTVGKMGGAKDVTMELENLIEHVHKTKRPRTDHVGDLYEPNSLKSDDDRGLYTGDTVDTEPAGNISPTPMKTMNPYVTGMWIEPIPGYFN